MDSSGNVYVADSGNYRIQKFTSIGGFIAKWTSIGPGSGFNYPTGVAVDSSENVYVADPDVNNGNRMDRVLKFTPAGGLLTQWGKGGSGDGQFLLPWGVAVAPWGDIYLADTYNNRIQVFDANGNYYTQWGGYGINNGQFKYPSGVAVDAQGYVYVADTNNDRVQKFDAEGHYIAKIVESGSSPHGIAVSSQGIVYVAHTNQNHIKMYFSSTLNNAGEFGGYGHGNGKLYSPLGLALDSSRNVYVADYNNGLIQKFTSNGVFISQWSGVGNPRGVAVAQGWVYVADGNRIQKFTLGGSLMDSWTSFLPGPGQFYNPMGLGAKPGILYVADTFSSRILGFGLPGSSPGALGLLLLLD